MEYNERMANANETVCVCIAAYNAAGTIARAVASALDQAEVGEIIVVDDASTDATAETARACDDGSGRLSVLSLDKNAGPSAARNAALSRSRAGIFCMLDSDDFFLPGRIGRLLTANVGDWDFLADDILIVPEELAQTAHIQSIEDAQGKNLTLDLETFVLSNVSDPRRPRAELGFLKPLIRRRFIDSRGMRYDPTMRLGEDYALYVRALMAGAIFKVAGFYGYIAVERSTSLSSQHRASDLAGIRDFDAQCLQYPGLAIRERQALLAHQQSTANKWALARGLEIKRDQGVGAALAFLAQQPRNVRYVASEIIRAKSANLSGRWRNAAAQPAELRVRRLIGQKPITAG